ncbi:MAG: hypothetical protein SFX73_32845 [Kofleriaceae bacterium]|nr:hypothetical protein [Kofleriaceae bacterium]
MVAPRRSPATYEDLLGVPDNQVDPLAQMLEVLELDGATYRISMVASREFDAIELDLAVRWQR